MPRLNKEDREKRAWFAMHDYHEMMCRKDAPGYRNLYCLTVHQVALLCGVRDDTVREWLRQRKLYFVKIPDISPSIRINVDQFKWFAKNYHNERYYVDDQMIEWIKYAPLYIMKYNPEIEGKSIDKEIRKVLKLYKEEHNANKTNESQL